MIFLFGPPCSGKSTILKAMEERNQFSTYDFDIEIDELIKIRKIKNGETLTDKFIDEAVKIYFQKLSNIPNDNLLCEISYHHYEKLIIDYPIISNNIIITLSAPLKTLINRNLKRVKNKQIPRVYIERCLESINKFKMFHDITNFDTSEKNIDDIVRIIVAKNE